METALYSFYTSDSVVITIASFDKWTLESLTMRNSAYRYWGRARNAHFINALWFGQLRVWRRKNTACVNSRLIARAIKSAGGFKERFGDREPRTPQFSAELWNADRNGRR